MNLTIMLVVTCVDAEDQEAGGQASKQFVIVEFLRRADGRIKQKILATGGKTSTRAVIVTRHVEAQWDVTDLSRKVAPQA